MNMLTQITFSSLFALAASVGTAGAEPADDMRARAEAAAKAATEGAPDSADEFDMDSRARAAAEAVRSPQRQAEIDAFKSRARSALGLTEGDGEVSNASPNRRHGETIAVVFVSSSVPLKTLRAYASQLERIGGVMVLRGAPGGLERMKPFLDFALSVLARDATCTAADCSLFDVPILIDPIIFDDYRVASVPAVAVTDRDPFTAYCDRDEDAPPGAFAVSFGDAHLSGHFQALSRLGETRAEAQLAQLSKGDRP